METRALDPVGGGSSNEQIVCPHCWHEFPFDQLLAIARHQDLVGDPVLGPEAPQRFLPSRFTPEGHAIDAHGTPCPDLACPRCHLAVPHVLLDRTPMFFSMIGAPASGKSYLLATMAWQLRSLLPQEFAFTFSDADSTCNRIVNEYEQILFFGPDSEDLVALEKTEMHGRMYDQVRLDNMVVHLPHPFVFTLQPQSHHPWIGTRDHLAQTLILYDNAGEHFEPGNDTATNPGTLHLARSSGVFFLFDPTKDSRFRAQCRSDDPQLRRGARTQRQEILLTEAFGRIKRHLGAWGDQKHDKPLVVVVTKFDIWRDLLKYPPGIPWERRPQAPASVLDMDVVMIVSLATRHLLSRLCPEFVSAAESLASKILYIPVSALGHSPVEDPANPAAGLLVRPKEISPVWATVPMLSMLAHHGLVPVVQRAKDDRYPAASECQVFGDRVRLTVPGTQQQLDVPANYLGRIMRCPETGKAFWLPSARELEGR